MLQTIQKPPPKVADTSDVLPIVLRVRPLIDLNDRQFAEFCELNPEVRIERTSTGEFEIMVPAIGFTGGKELEIARQLGNWARQDGTGAAFGPSMGYTLPNGAVRAPDASWIPRSRRTELTPDDLNRFIPLCPDFVLELRSNTDRLSVLQAKMQEYMDNGARLGLLIDPLDRRVYIYRPDREIETLDNPESVSADPVLPAFTLDLKEIWEWDL